MEEDFYGDGSLDNFISDRQRLMIMKDEARKKNKKVRLADFAKKYGEDGYQVDALGEVFRDNKVTGKREFFGNFEGFKPSKPKRIGDTPKSNPIDKEAAFIESEVAEFDGPQPSATTQMELANYTSLADDVSAQPTSAGTNNTSTRQKLNVGPATGRAAMRERNVARFGEERVSYLERQNAAFQDMKKGKMTKAEFAKKFPKSQTAKRLKIRK